MDILVVDDDVVSREVMKAVCEELGYHVKTAENGADALAVFMESPFRIIMSDWVMPEMDGVELCRKIRELTEKTYTFFFLITGKKTKLRDYNAALQAGADDFIYKPIDPDVFRNQLRMAQRVLGLVDAMPSDMLRDAA